MEFLFLFWPEDFAWIFRNFLNFCRVGLALTNAISRDVVRSGGTEEGVASGHFDDTEGRDAWGCLGICRKMSILRQNTWPRGGTEEGPIGNRHADKKQH